MNRINEISPWLLKTENLLSEGNSASFRRESGLQHLDKSWNHQTRVTCNNHLSHNPHQNPTLNSVNSTVSEGLDHTPPQYEYTFVYRGKELKSFLDFLQRRSPGLVSRGYSVQLNLSLISLLGGAIAFLIKLQSMNSKNVMYYTYGNCTVS